MKKVADSFYYHNVFETKEEIISPNEVIVSEDEIEPPQYFCNRLIVCFFALCLLWTTTLANCVYLVNLFLPTPSFTLVMDHCTDFIQLINANEQSYRNCIALQLKVCQQNLLIATNQQKIRISQHEEKNLIFENLFLTQTNNCSNQYNQLQNQLHEWLTLGENYTIPYQPSCSNEKKAMVSQLIGDQSATALTIQSSSDSYVSLSNARIASLISYSNALSSYNQEYIHNKTKDLHLSALQLLSNEMIQIQSVLQSQELQIENITEVMIACLSLNPNTTMYCPYAINAASIYSLESNYINDIIDSMQEMMAESNRTMYQFRSEVMTAAENMNAFYNSIVSDTGILAWLINTGLIPDASFLCGRSSPNWCDFTPWDWVLPYIDLQLINFFPQMPDASYLWNEIEGISNEEQQLLLQQFEDLNLKLTAEFSNLLINIDNLNWNVLTDYNPPRYQDPSNPSANLSDILTDQLQSSKKFQNALYREIYQQNSTIQSLQSTNSTSARSFLSTLANNLQSTLLSSFQTTWASFDNPNINYAVWLSSLLTIQGIFFLFDYIYRVIQSIKLIANFWNKGVVRLPIITLASSAAGEKKKTMPFGQGINSSYLTMLNWFIRLLPLIWFQLLSLIILIIIISIIISTLLIPEYQSYVSSCVNHQQNETFLSANLAALAIDYASFQGNSDFTIGINDYNNQITLICNEETVPSLVTTTTEAILGNQIPSNPTYSDVLQTLYNSNLTYTQTIAQWEDLTSCIDMDQFLKDLSNYCSQASSASSSLSTAICSSSLLKSFTTTYCDRDYTLSATSFSSSVASNSLTRSIAALAIAEDDVIDHPYLINGAPTNVTEVIYSNGYFGQTQSTEFYCSQLPSCEMTCMGPDVTILHNSAHDCSCMVEWYWNGMLVQFSFAIIIYVIINIGRLIVCRGLLKIFWKHLTPPVYECRTECDEHGNILAFAESIPKLLPPSQFRLNKEKLRLNHNVFCQAGKDAERNERLPDHELIVKVREEMKEIIVAKMRWFVGMGYGFVLVGICLNIPWLYYLFQVSNQLEYSPRFITSYQP